MNFILSDNCIYMVRQYILDAAIIMRLVCALLLVFLSVLCAAENSDLGDRARLVVTKEVLNRYLVEAKEVTLLYTIHNLSPK